jgi:hypothetical protein
MLFDRAPVAAMAAVSSVLPESTMISSANTTPAHRKRAPAFGNQHQRQQRFGEGSNDFSIINRSGGRL